MNKTFFLITLLFLTLTTETNAHPLVESPIVKATSYIEAVWNYAQWHVFFIMCHFAGWFGVIGGDKGSTYLACINNFTAAFPVNV